mmetsp:Transcript_97452/g.303081  ORF Transcript_97452/g.303081 Transcript_97452/m.303081 type:complete len:203 (+) Transcript_97452:2-610(+)
MAPTAPFSRNSCTVLFHSSLRPWKTEFWPSTGSPWAWRSAQAALAASAAAGSRMGTSSGSSRPAAATRARAGSDTPSTSVTVASTTLPSAKCSETVVPRFGTLGPRRKASAGSSSATRFFTPSTSQPPAPIAMSFVSSAASRRAPMAPFCRKSSTVPITSWRSTFHKDAMPGTPGSAASGQQHELFAGRSAHRAETKTTTLP